MSAPAPKGWEFIKQFLGASETDRIDKAIDRATNLCGDAMCQRVRSEFYTELLFDIDPQKEWWKFADLKQKQYDAQMEFVALDRQADAAMKRAQDVIRKK